MAERLIVIDTTRPLRLGYDLTNTVDFFVGNTGNLTITPVGGFVVIAGALASTGSAFVGGSTNAFSTLGMTIDQKTADNEALTLKSSGDVATGMTSISETDSFMVARKYLPASGGALIRGLSSDKVAINLEGDCTTEDAARSNAALAPLMFSSYKKSGTAAAALAGDKNIACFASGATVRFIFDSDGDSHQDVGTAWTNFDTHDDVALLNLLSAHVTRRTDPLREAFGGWLKENRDELVRVRLVTFNDHKGGDGSVFLNMSRTTMLLVGAARQLGNRVAVLEQKLLLAQN